MRIQQIFFKNTLRNFCYVIIFDDGAIYCIDPFTAQEVRAFLGDKKSLTGIINTHDHWDHHQGNGELVETFNCPVFAHVKANIPGMTKGLLDGDVIYKNSEWSLESLYTPGHTLSHICLMLKKDGKPYAVFTGDCFFNAGVGNCHNGGDPEILFATIHDIFSTFPDELLVYPGHDYLKRNLEFTMDIEASNTEAEKFLAEITLLDLNEIFFINDMKIERKINTFLRLQNPAIQRKLNMSNADDKEVFIKLRELRNKW
ncbi:MAG: MBL fold metallo-hydrolase [Bacteriovorax sp.]|nr:MBL fold metallo-hydrolase [Bacteriovorax sp.]